MRELKGSLCIEVKIGALESRAGGRSFRRLHRYDKDESAVQVSNLCNSQGL